MGIYSRVKNFKNKEGSIRSYLYLVRNYWDRKSQSTEQKNICCLGRVDNPETSKLVDNIIHYLLPFSSKGKFLDLEDFDVDEAKTYGEIQIFRKLWESLGLERTLRKYFEEKNKKRE